MSSTQSRLEFIAEAEGVKVSPEVISALVSTSGGDLRRSITYLQSASRLSASTTPPTPITPSDIQEIAGVVPDHIIEGFADVLGVDVVRTDGMDIDSGESRAKNFDAVRKKVKQLVRDGYSAAQILSQVRGPPEVLFVWSSRPLQLHDLVILHPNLNARQKSRCALIFAEADKALCDGADEELWVLEVGTRVWKALAPVKN